MSAEAFPDGLSAVLGYYSEDLEIESLDPETPLDTALTWLFHDGHTVDRARHELAAVLHSDVDDADLGRRHLPLVPLPAGGSVRSFLRYVDQRLADAAIRGPVAGDPGYLLGRSEGVAHRSRFPSVDVANASATEVLRANEAALRHWTSEGGDVPRLHLVAELERPVGWATPLDEYGSQDGEPELVRTCVVVMGVVGHGSRDRPTVLTCYPERPVDDGVRARWPGLVPLFGGFFNQDVRARDRSHWQAERAFHEQAGAALRAAVVRELDDLLAASDDDAALTAALHSLGSCTLPVNPRRWVRGLRRRMTDLDWTR